MIDICIYSINNIADVNVNLSLWSNFCSKTNLYRFGPVIRQFNLFDNIYITLTPDTL